MCNMAKKWWIYAALALPFVVMVFLIGQNENIRQNGQVFRFLIQPPYNECKGNEDSYTRLVFANEKVVVKGFKPDWQESFYIQLQVDSAGFAMPVSASPNCKDGNNIKATQFGSSQDSLSYHIIDFRYGFDEFHLNQGKAKEVNMALRKALTDGKSKAWMEVRIKGCKAIPTGIFVDGKALR